MLATGTSTRTWKGGRAPIIDTIAEHGSTILVLYRSPNPPRAPPPCTVVDTMGCGRSNKPPPKETEEEEDEQEEGKVEEEDEDEEEEEEEEEE